MNEPSQLKKCTMVDLGDLLDKKIDTYIWFDGGDPENKGRLWYREHKRCVTSENDLLWDNVLSEFNYFKSSWERYKTTPNDPWLVDYIPSLFDRIVKWTTFYEKKWSSINDDKVKSCLNFYFWSFTSNDSKTSFKNYKEETNNIYHEVIEKYNVAINLAKDYSQRDKIWNDTLKEIFAVYDTAGKKRIEDHHKLFTEIQNIAKAAPARFTREKAKIDLAAKIAADLAAKIAADTAKIAADKQKKADAAIAAAEIKRKNDANGRRAAIIGPILKRGGCMDTRTSNVYENGKRVEFANGYFTCKNGVWTAEKASTNNSQNQSCRNPTTGMLENNGKSINFSDGTRTCVNGKWNSPSASGGSSGSKKTLVSKSCELSTTGASSDWNGIEYSWRIYNHWSDGSKSIASIGSGYGNKVPYGC